MISRDLFFEMRSGEPHHLSVVVNSQKVETQRLLNGLSDIYKYPGRQDAMSAVLAGALRRMSELLDEWSKSDEREKDVRGTVPKEKMTRSTKKNKKT